MWDARKLVKIVRHRVKCEQQSSNKDHTSPIHTALLSNKEEISKMMDLWYEKVKESIKKFDEFENEMRRERD